jgi:hypothetical protein
MTIPAAFSTALGRRSNEAIWWIEIAGIPYAFGTRTKSSSFWTQSATVLDADGNAIPAREEYEQFAGMKPWLGTDDKGIFDPQLSPQSVDYFEGRVNIGTARLVVVDVDGSLAGYTGTRRQDGWLRLQEDTGPDDDTIVLSGAPANPGLGAVLHIAREAVKYTGRSTTTVTNDTMTGCVRGFYRSLRRSHGGVTTTGKGAVAATYPRGLEGRRCWLYYGLDCDDARTALCLFAGYVRSTAWQNGARELVLAMDDGQGLLAKSVFTDLADTFATPKSTATPKFGGLVNAPPYGQSLVLFDGTYSGGDLETVNILGPNDSILAIKADASIPLEFIGLNPGDLPAFTVLGAVLAKADVEFTQLPAKACIVIAPYDVAGTRFGAGNHPLQVALQIITSTGEGNNGSYDTLPADWGCGLDGDQVDVDAFEQLIHDTPGLLISLVVIEAEAAREFIVRECLKPFGFYLRPTVDGRISVGQLATPPTVAISSVETITDEDLAVDEQGQVIQLDGPVQSVADVVGGVSWSDSPALINGEIVFSPETIVRIVEDVTDPMELENTKIVEVKAAGLQGDRVGQPGAWGNDGGTDGSVVRAAFVAMCQSRFGKPPSVLTVAVKIMKMLTTAGRSLSVGDFVSVTLANVPDIFTGGRGITDAIHEITSRRWNVAEGTIVFELARTGIGNVATRYIAPAADVFSWDSVGKVLTVLENSFSPSGKADTDAFRHGIVGVGDVVRIYTADLGTRSDPVTVTGSSATTLTLSGTPGSHTPAAGDVVLLDDYDGGTSGMRAASAYRSDSAEGLGSGNDTTHVHG